MYSFLGNLDRPERFRNDRYLARLLEGRSRRLQRWYRFINRNRPLGKALAILFGALELAIVEGARFFTRIAPSVEGRFVRLLDGKWGSKIVPLNVEIEGVSTSVLPSQQILEIAKRTPIRSLNWCYCHHTYGKRSPGEPDRYSCLALGWGQNLDEINSLARNNPDKKIGKNLTYQQVEEKLKEWNERGYVHQLIFFPSPEYFYIICACHPDFCLTLSNVKKWGFPSVVKSDFIVHWNESECEGCGRCVERCHFGAFSRDVDGRVSFDQGRCAGCGLCATTCPSKAVRLQPRAAMAWN